MTTPKALWMHDGISEREVAHRWPNGAFDNSAWEDCTWDAALMWYRDSYDPSKPSTHFEAERLRQASGENTWSGSNPNDIRKGIEARYHRVIPIAITGWSSLRLALGVGHNAMASGSMGAFPRGHRLRRFDANFDGFHAVHAAKVDTMPRYWVTNPLAPEDHDGEWWSEDEFRRFIQAGFNLWNLVAKTLPIPASIPTKAKTQMVHVKQGSFWRYEIRGTRSDGYAITRLSKLTAGFSGPLGRSRIDTKDNEAFDPTGEWRGRRRLWAKVVGGAFEGVWIDLLEGANITVT